MIAYIFAIGFALAFVLVLSTWNQQAHCIDFAHFESEDANEWCNRLDRDLWIDDALNKFEQLVNETFDKLQKEDAKDNYPDERATIEMPVQKPSEPETVAGSIDSMTKCANGCYVVVFDTRYGKRTSGFLSSSLTIAQAIETACARCHINTIVVESKQVLVS